MDKIDFPGDHVAKGMLISLLILEHRWFGGPTYFDWGIKSQIDAMKRKDNLLSSTLFF
jgi:hypothetical protein